MPKLYTFSSGRVAANNEGEVEPLRDTFFRVCRDSNWEVVGDVPASVDVVDATTGEVIYGRKSVTSEKNAFGDSVEHEEWKVEKMGASVLPFAYGEMGAAFYLLMDKILEERPDAELFLHTFNLCDGIEPGTKVLRIMFYAKCEERESDDEI